MEQTAGGTALLDPTHLLQQELGITPGSVVGDLGCGGAGYFAMTAARLVGQNGKVFAVDVLKSALANIASRKEMEKLTNIETVWSNLEVFGGTKINNNTLDYALLTNILFQNSNKLAILKEAGRLLKQGGKLLVIDWHEGRFALGPQPKDKVSKEEVIALARQAGLAHERTFPAGMWHYGLIFTK